MKLCITHCLRLLPFFYAFVLIGLCTTWTFNLFEPQFLWKAYNYYFLSLLEGRLDIPVEAIGREGGYFDSKAYMYYGLLPALSRIFLYPFFDLTQTPAALFSILFFTILGLTFLQSALNSAFFDKGKSFSNTTNFLWLLLTTISWLGSATFVISQGGTIYHEPYAASLCLFNIYLSLLIKDRFLIDKNRLANPIGYALVAALAVHARMPLALALFLTTGFIFLLLSYRALVLESKNIHVLNLCTTSIARNWLSILVLALGGFSILLITYLKYGNPTSFMGGNYGYFFLEGFTERRCNIIPKSEYAKWLRIIPNTYIYLTGDWAHHWSLSVHLKTGYGRWEAPLVPLIALWSLPFLAVVFTLLKLLSGLKKRQNQLLLIGFLLISIGALFQLTYPTITHRYIAELWPPFMLALVWLAYTYREKNLKPAVKLLVGFIGLIGLSYQLSLAITDKYYIENGPIYKHHNFHYSEEDHQFLSSLTPEKVSELQFLNKKMKKDACQKLAKELDMEYLIDK